MKLDTSSYYPKSPLDDDEPDHSAYMPGSSSSVPDTGSEPHEAVQFRTEGSGDSGMPEHSGKRAESKAESEPDLPPTRQELIVDNLSTAVSWIMSPLLMPVYGIVLVFMLTVYSYVTLSVKLGFTLVVAGITIILPILSVLLLKHLGMVSDLGLNHQKERTIPYIITILCMGGTGVFLAMKGFPMWVVMFYAGGALAGLIEAIINNWWKISAHAAGVAGLVAMLVRMSRTTMVNPDMLTWLVAAVVCAGLTGSARLWLGRHTLGQVLAGYTVGFCSVYFLTMI